MPLLAVLLGLVGLQGCTPEPDAEPGTPLLEVDPTLTLLVERSRIDLPPTSDAHRFLAGWRPWRFEDRTALGVSPRGARFQMVQLAARPRSLVLDLVQDAPPGSGVQARAAGRELGTFPLVDPLTIELPADLPLGRVPVELTPVGSPPPPLDVLGVGLRPVLPAGSVERQGDDLVQSGDSRVEWLATVAAGHRLVGELVPPTSPSPEQRFRITVSRQRQPAASGLRDLEQSHFEWRATEPDGSTSRSGIQRLTLSSGSSRSDEPAGLVKVTLGARGQGPPVRWRNLRWIPAAPTASPALAPPPEPPRIVLVYVMDALRADFVGHLGGPEDISPTWDRLAREGVTFRNHRSVAPSTLPSTRALFSGHIFRFPEEYASIDGMPLLAERFRDAGYRTGLFSGNGFVSRAYGLDRGFDHVAEEVLYGPDSPGERGGVNVNAARVQQAALTWLDSLQPEDRAFLYLHTIHPHNPYAPPPKLVDHFTGSSESSIDGSTATLKAIHNGERQVSDADRQRLRGLYAAAFAYNDRRLAELIADLEARFEAGEVLVVLTSDHGEELFEHSGALHGYTFYEEMLRIPLTLWWPRALSPGSADYPTDSLDLHATLSELVGAGSHYHPDESEPSPRGRSLWPWLVGDTSSPTPRLHFAAAPGVRGGIFAATDVRAGTPPLKLVVAAHSRHRWGLGKGPGRTWDPEYYFDLGFDPGERVNRVGNGGLDELRLHRRLRAWIQQGETLRRQALLDGNTVSKPELDAETRERLRSLGYLQ